MNKTSIVAYALLLVVAFAAGLGGTIAVTLAVTSPASEATPRPRLEAPASSPTAGPGRPRLFSVEC